MIGVHNLFGRFLHKCWKKRHTHYAVTNQRVIILYRSLTQNLQALHIDRLPGLNKSIGLFGLGTITFGFAPIKQKRRMNFTWNPEDELLGFHGIRDGDEAFTLITGLRRRIRLVALCQPDGLRPREEPAFMVEDRVQGEVMQHTFTPLPRDEIKEEESIVGNLCKIVLQHCLAQAILPAD